jgi:hypothetical protein
MPEKRATILDYPMTMEATVAQITGNRALSLTVAHSQACHVTVKWVMCPRWRKRKRRLLEAEMRHRWRLALTIRDSLAEKWSYDMEAEIDKMIALAGRNGQAVA